MGSYRDPPFERINEESMNGADAGWLWRYRDVVDVDGDGRRLFHLDRRFPQPSFGYLDVLLAVSAAVVIVAVSGSLRFDVDHIDVYLRPDDAFRLGYDLMFDTGWPKWPSAAAVVDGEPEADTDITVVVVGPLPINDRGESRNGAATTTHGAEEPDPISAAERQKMQRWLLEFLRRGTQY